MTHKQAHNQEAATIPRRKRSGRGQPDARSSEQPPGAHWVTPTVHTLLDMAPLPSPEVLPPRAGEDLVVREWDLLGFGILMSADGILHALDPVAYRTWQLHKQYGAVDDVALALTNEWDVEIDKARRDALVVLRRLKEAAPAASA